MRTSQQPAYEAFREAEKVALHRCLEGTAFPHRPRPWTRVRGAAASPSVSLDRTSTARPMSRIRDLTGRGYFDRLRSGLSDRKAQKHPDRCRERDCE
jgi:hypothetical protein